MAQMLTNEIAAYQSLRDLYGKFVPRFLNAGILPGGEVLIACPPLSLRSLSMNRGKHVCLHVTPLLGTMRFHRDAGSYA